MKREDAKRLKQIMKEAESLLNKYSSNIGGYKPTTTINFRSKLLAKMRKQFAKFHGKALLYLILLTEEIDKNPDATR